MSHEHKTNLFCFAKDGMKLQQNALEVLDQVALVLEKHPRLPIVVEVCLGPQKAIAESINFFGRAFLHHFTS